MKFAYAIEFVGGGQVEEIIADSNREAVECARVRFPDHVFAEQWDAMDDDSRGRLLIWKTEDDAENDDGGMAVAQLTREPV